MTSPRRARLAVLVATTLAVSASALVLAAYLAHASALVAYPWDWSPDEGLYLDHARRLASSPASLNPRSFVPFPSAYGPLLPAILAPALATPQGPLFGARLVAIAWTLAGALAVYLLVRQKAPPVLALAACALSLALLDLSFWHVLVRPDGPMLTFWLLAAVPLLPVSLARGTDRLGTARLVAGTALVMAACLSKPTAVVHGAPLVLGWLLVDRRSALRLAGSLAAAGLVTVLALQWISDGGFLWVNRVWAFHPSQPSLPLLIVGYFASRAWPLLLLAGVSLVLAARASRASLRDASWLLIAGALLVLPLTAKYGASWNYLVPALPALAVATGRWWPATGEVLGVPRAAGGAALLATLALALALTREFPVPTAEDERTARAFYGYVTAHTRATGGPLLTLRPELASYLVGQPVEMEGSGFFHLGRGKAPGTELVLERLQQARYTLVVVTWPLPDTGGYQEAAARSYVHAGGCTLGYYFGTVTATLLPRRDLYQPVPNAPGIRCGPPPPAAAGLRPSSPKEPPA